MTHGHRSSAHKGSSSSPHHERKSHSNWIEHQPGTKKHHNQGIPHLSDEGRTGRESIPPISADKVLQENQGTPGVAETGKLNAVEQGQARHWGDKKYKITNQLPDQWESQQPDR